jgi:E3 ubiquitin-protein ligase RNF13
MSRRRFLLLLLAAASASVRPSAALVRLGATSFLDAPARFGEQIEQLAASLARTPLSKQAPAVGAGPRVNGDGICGSLRAADPADACAPIRNRAGSGPGMAFVLIARGNCSFEGKVLEAQLAGYDAAVVYDDEEKASLYSSELPATSSLCPLFLLFCPTVPVSVYLNTR